MKLLTALILGAFTATLLVLVGMSRRGVVGPVTPYPPEGDDGLLPADPAFVAAYERWYRGDTA